MTTGPVQRAIRSNVLTGAVLTTPAQSAPFTVAVVDERGVVLLLGEKEARTRFTWDALEGVLNLFAGGNWIEIGSRYSTDGRPGTLDGYLKQHIRRATAAWVAALLEAAGLVEIDRRLPTRLRRR